MSKLLGFVGATIGSYLGWWLGSRAGIMTAFMVSMVGTGAGIYLGRRVALRYLALLALFALPSTAQAQKKWTPIGTTSSGNQVFVDSKSIKKTGSLVAATVRVVFTTPVQTPKGAWMSSRTSATFDCAKKALAAKENVFYGDVRETTVVDRKVNKIPGYGPALGGSLGDVALKYLCALG